eukprot:TRINITY_DN43424_c0_g1_i1.p1 TRINITY_DN43424_c0_g1~~TRINITY_DN43424_c0_g1_i1.p1  ORF type:complete len:670 (+),score=180.32 TRINITY_DN43424_c0_g1_i1:113-2122(+)
MGEVLYTYSRPRREFGRPPEFHCHPASSLEVDLHSDPAVQKLWTIADPCDRETDNVAAVADATTNTDRTRVDTKGMMHTEGGWPQGVEPTENVSKWKFVKRLERQENYASAISALTEPIGSAVRQNNAVDLYERYFTESCTNPVADPAALDVVEVLRCPPQTGGRVLQVSWSPSGGKMAAAHCCAAGKQSLPSMLWDVMYPEVPEAELHPHGAELACVSYGPKDPHFIAGGVRDGTLQWWDTRSGAKPVAMSNPLESHTDTVTGLSWLTAKTCEVITVSLDGRALWWDLRQHSRPVDEEELLLRDPHAPADAPLLGGVSVHHDPLAGGPSRFLVGSDAGAVLCCIRRGRAADRVESCTYAHHGPVYSVARCPGHAGGTRQHALKGFFLSVGDWTARLWVEQRGRRRSVPIWQTPFRDAQLLAGCWVGDHSAGAFLCARVDGKVEAWDVMQSQKEPVCTTQVSHAAVLCLEMQQQLPDAAAPQLVGTGDAAGHVRLCRVRGSIAACSGQEQREWAELLDREEVSSRNLPDDWWQQTRHSAARPAALSAQVLEVAVEAEVSPGSQQRMAWSAEQLDAELSELETEFTDAVRTELNRLALKDSDLLPLDVAGAGWDQPPLLHPPPAKRSAPDPDAAVHFAAESDMRRTVSTAMQGSSHVPGAPSSPSPPASP